MALSPEPVHPFLDRARQSCVLLVGDDEGNQYSFLFRTRFL